MRGRGKREGAIMRRSRREGQFKSTSNPRHTPTPRFIDALLDQTTGAFHDLPTCLPSLPVLAVDFASPRHPRRTTPAGLTGWGADRLLQVHVRRLVPVSSRSLAHRFPSASAFPADTHPHSLRIVHLAMAPKRRRDDHDIAGKQLVPRRGTSGV